MEKPKSQTQINSEFRKTLFEKMVSQLTLIDEAALAGQTDVASITFDAGNDEKGNQRFATIKLTLHNLKYDVEKFDEEIENYDFTVKKRIDKAQSREEKEKTN